MNVEVTRLPESRVALKVELTPQEVDQAFERTYKQLVQRVNIPGFRKGKAPRPVVERLLGHELFVHEATEEAVRWGYRKAVDEVHLTPIDEAEINAGDGDHDHVEAGHPFQFEATVAVRPDVQLPDYKTIHLDRPEVEVDEQDIDDLIRRLQESHATLEPVVRPAQIGDVVTMNMVAKVEGIEVLNDENFEYELRDESGDDAVTTPLPGLSAELTGANRGDIREVTLHLPELYVDPELADKTMFLRILVKEIKRKVPPELDDEFAQSVGEFQTLEEVRDTLRQNLLLERKLEADEKVVGEAVEAVTSRTFVEIPPLLIAEELDRMIDDMRGMFERQRLSFETYVEAGGKTEAQIRDDMRESAIQNVKTSLVVAAIAEAEHIEVSNREVDTALEEVLRQSASTDVERRKLRTSNAVRSNIRNRIRRQRAIERLVAIVTGSEEVSSEAAEAVADQTVATAEDTEETVAVEVGG